MQELEMLYNRIDKYNPELANDVLQYIINNMKKPIKRPRKSLKEFVVFFKTAKNIKGNREYIREIVEATTRELAGQHVKCKYHGCRIVKVIVSKDGRLF